MHWRLEVTFSEEQSRIRKGLADRLFSALRRPALTQLMNNTLKNNTSQKFGAKNKCVIAFADERCLEDLPTAS